MRDARKLLLLGIAHKFGFCPCLIATVKAVSARHNKDRFLI